ncbi:MAG: LPXTG cell wall anchor domain-containing protein [Clostridia bacterium]|nr:LPXTG cell wall anchor domain-containing protein [Clostridia bacterium]
MKKIITIVLAVVMVLSLCTLTAFAEAEPKVVEKASDLFDDLDKSVASVVATLKEEDGVRFVNFDVAGNADPWLKFITPLEVGADNKYAVVKYRTSSTAVASIDFYLQIAEPHSQNTGVVADGAWHNLVCNLETPFPDSMATLWSGSIARFDMMNGSGSNWAIDIAWIAFFDNEADANAFTGASIVDDAPIAVTYSNKAIGGADNNIGVWVQGENNYATVKFTTAGGFKGFGLPIYWASNANVPNGPFAKYSVELFKFDTNTEKTLAGNPVKSAYDIQGQGDNNPALAITFDEPLEAGTYIAKFTLTNNTEELVGKMNGQGDDVTMTPYLVLPKMNAGNPDASKFEFNVDPFNFYVIGEDGIADFYAVNPEDSEAPATGEDEPRDFSSESGDKLSYDQILVNGEEIANGNDAVIAAKKLVDGSDGSIQTIALHGWFGNATSKIRSYGYMIDDGEPVYGDFAVAAGQDVIDAGGESRYTVVVDVTGLQDGQTHKIQVVAELENGDVVILNRMESGKDRDVYVNYKAPLTEEPQPQTGDATVIMLAVIAVLAMGAAVVFMKKRVF